MLYLCLRLPRQHQSNAVFPLPGSLPHATACFFSAISAAMATNSILTGPNYHRSHKLKEPPISLTRGVPRCHDTSSVVVYRWMVKLVLRSNIWLARSFSHPALFWDDLPTHDPPMHMPSNDSATDRIYSNQSGTGPSVDGLRCRTVWSPD